MASTLPITLTEPTRVTNTQQSDRTGNDGMDTDLGIGSGVDRNNRSITSTSSSLVSCICDTQNQSHHSSSSFEHHLPH
jgi:hypothetical protein